MEKAAPPGSKSKLEETSLLCFVLRQFYWNCKLFVSLQSISNFIVSLPNLSKGCEGATVPAVAALTLPRPMEQKRSSCRPLFSVQWGQALICTRREKENSFPPLCIPPFLWFVFVSWKAERVLQARDIRRIDFSVTFRHDWCFSCGNGKSCPIDSKSKLEETSLLCFVSLLNWYSSKHKYLSFLSAQEINCIFESR